LKGIHEFLDESIVLPPGDWDHDLFPFDELKEKSKANRIRRKLRIAAGVEQDEDEDFPDSRKPSQGKLAMPY
jgi:hypothetical protein